MKKNKMLLVLSVFAALILVLVACNNEPETAQAPGNDAPATTAPAAEVATDAAEEPDVSGDELVLTIHYHAGPNGVFDDDWPVWQEIAAATGVRLTGTANPIADDSVEQFNFEAVNQFPADIYAGPNLGPLFMEYGMQGAFQPLNDLIAQYAPNIRALLDERPYIENFITAADGNIYWIPNVQDGLITYTTFMRQDWLDILELDQPQTLEEFEAMLVAFRDEMPGHTGNDTIYPFFGDNWLHMMRMIPMFGARAFGNDNPSMRVVLPEDNDQMYHAWLTDEFMVAIQYLSRWYDEGLIDPQIFTRGGTSRQEMLSQNRGGVTIHWPVSTAAFNDQLRDTIDGFSFQAINPVVGLDGRRSSESMRTPVTNAGWAISHTNQNPVETIQMMDFLFSMEGRVLMTFGIEGVTWETVNGNRAFTDMVFEQEMPPTNFLRTQGGIRWIGWRALFEHEEALAAPEAQNAFNIMNNPDLFLRQTPPLGFTADEQSTIEDIDANLRAYLDENVQAMILNPWTEVEGRWEGFVSGAIAMGSDELVEALQSAFDRYMQHFGN